MCIHIYHGIVGMEFLCSQLSFSVCVCVCVHVHVCVLFSSTLTVQHLNHHRGRDHVIGGNGRMDNVVECLPFLCLYMYYTH